MPDRKVTVRRRVEQAARSPMNKMRWLVALDCGHEEWITSSIDPDRGEPWVESLDCGHEEWITSSSKPRLVICSACLAAEQPEEKPDG